jgi:F0F1-type ATP synthase membrane subunit b/b'
MSSLELKPEPVIVLVQGAIFLASVFSVKKLMLDPFMRIRARRKALTEGRFAEARKTVSDAETKLTGIREQLREAAIAAKKEREGIMEQAKKERATLVEKAEQEGKAHLGTIKAQIKSDLDQERGIMKDQVARLAKQAMEQVLQ